MKFPLFPSLDDIYCTLSNAHGTKTPYSITVIYLIDSSCIPIQVIKLNNGDIAQAETMF